MGCPSAAESWEQRERQQEEERGEMHAREKRPEEVEERGGRGRARAALWSEEPRAAHPMQRGSQSQSPERDEVAG